MTDRFSPEIARARETLLHAAMSQGRRARRAGAGANGRTKALRCARWLSACVAEIDVDKNLRRHLEREGKAGAGWRVLGRAVAEFCTERDRKKGIHV